MEMKIKIDIGTRETLKEFKNAYTAKFLKLHGYKEYGYQWFGEIVTFKTVKTKYGELVVHDNDVLTYLGHKLWAATEDKEHENED